MFSRTKSDEYDKSRNVSNSKYTGSVFTRKFQVKKSLFSKKNFFLPIWCAYFHHLEFLFCIM